MRLLNWISIYWQCEHSNTNRQQEKSCSDLFRASSGSRLRGTACKKQFPGQPTFAGWVASEFMLEASAPVGPAAAAAGTGRLKEFAFRKSSTQMEPEQRAGSWQQMINNSLQTVWRNHWERQVKKCNLWGACEVTKTTVPEAPSIAPPQRRQHRCPSRDGTLHPQGEGPREREPSLPGPPRCHSQGVGVGAVISPLTPQCSNCIPRGAFTLLLPVRRQASDAFTETGNDVFYAVTVPTLGFLSFYCWCLPLLRLEVPCSHDSGFISGFIKHV